MAVLEEEQRLSNAAGAQRFTRVRALIAQTLGPG
jgi:hypothetical protein